MGTVRAGATNDERAIASVAEDGGPGPKPMKPQVFFGFWPYIATLEMASGARTHRSERHPARSTGLRLRGDGVLIARWGPARRARWHGDRAPPAWSQTDRGSPRSELRLPGRPRAGSRRADGGRHNGSSGHHGRRAKGRAQRRSQSAGGAPLACWDCGRRSSLAVQSGAGNLRCCQHRAAVTGLATGSTMRHGSPLDSPRPAALASGARDRSRHRARW
jgi:hypothetical protein